MSELSLIRNRKCPCCEKELDIAEDDTQYLCKSCDIMFPIPVKEPFMTRPWLKMIIFCVIVWAVFGCILFSM